jgi:putative addiction module killer protein
VGRRLDFHDAQDIPDLGVLIVRILKDTLVAIAILQTEEYEKWFETLRDIQARARIDIRIRRLSLGNPGDVRPVGSGVSELRVDYGPGYRIYFISRGVTTVILLGGGPKSTQQQDIARAIELARNL